MKWVYSFALILYGLVIRFASVFNPKAKEWIVGRNDWQSQLTDLPSSVVWFHCASLGEFDQGLPVMWELKKKNPNCYMLVTFFSPSGMNHFHKRKHCVDKAVYLPLDTPMNARKFIQLVQPKLVVFVKYEFWANYIFELKTQKIQLISIATILRPTQIYFQFYGGFFRKILQSFDFFYVQNKETSFLLKSIGIGKIKVVGDTRFDNVIANKLNFESKQKSEADTIFKQFLSGNKAIIFGSSWEDEERILVESLAELKNEKIIIAPHSVNENNCQRLMQLFGKRAIRFTKFEDFSNQSILILDTIGHLSSAYYYGKVAFVGGGFSGQLHNILEPAVFGLPLFFGPKHTKFPEAAIFCEEGFAFDVDSVQLFLKKLAFVEENKVVLSQKAIGFIEKQKGVAERIVNDLKFP